MSIFGKGGRKAFRLQQAKLDKLKTLPDLTLYFIVSKGRKGRRVIDIDFDKENAHRRCKDFNHEDDKYFVYGQEVGGWIVIEKRITLGDLSKAELRAEQRRYMANFKKVEPLCDQRNAAYKAAWKARERRLAKRRAQYAAGKPKRLKIHKATA